MGKYLISYKNSLSSFFQYRLNLGLLFVSHIISFSGLLYLWIAVYASGQQVGNYSLEGIILYYVLLLFVRVTVANGVGMGFQVSEQINQGIITNYLLKPFSFSLETAMKQLGEMTINLLFISPVIFGLFYIGRNYIPIPSVVVWLQFVGFLLLAGVFYFLLYYLSALSSFWLTNGKNFIYGMIIISMLLNGSLLPLDLFPEWFQQISAYLPFQFLVFVPIQIFLERVPNIPFTLMMAALWTILFYLGIVFTWKRGVKKFEAVGR